LLEQLDQVLARAAAAGVDRVVTIGTDIEDAMAAIELCARKPNVRCAVGIHPNYTANATVDDVPKLRELQKQPTVLAIGEMGLDYPAPVKRPGASWMRGIGWVSPV
jgi:TatD DNase family protein